jgi:hypothetical protein
MRQRNPRWAAGARGEDLIDWEEDQLQFTARPRHASSAHAHTFCNRDGWAGA